MIGTHALLIFLPNFYHGSCCSLPLVCALLSGSHGSLQEEAEKERDLEREKTGPQLFLRSLALTRCFFFMNAACHVSLYVFTCVNWS